MKQKQYISDFQQHKTIRVFGESIYTRKVNIVQAEEYQSNLLRISTI